MSFERSPNLQETMFKFSDSVVMEPLSLDIWNEINGRDGRGGSGMYAIDSIMLQGYQCQLMESKWKTNRP